MKYAKKLISTLLSLLILTTCVPVQAFAQDVMVGWGQEVNWKELAKNREFFSAPVTYNPAPIRAVQLQGEESIHAGVRKGHKGDWLLLTPTGERRIYPASGFEEFFETAPEVGDGWFKIKGGPRRLAEKIKEIHAEEYPTGREWSYGKGGWLDVEDGFFVSEEWFTPAKEYSLETVKRSAPNLTPQEVAELLKYDNGTFILTQKELADLLEHDAGKLFGEADTYFKFARVQAYQSEGEYIQTILKKGHVEVKEPRWIEKGEWIIINPGGEKYAPGSKFAKRYVPAPELGEGWFKPKGGPQDFRRMKRGLVFYAPASWESEKTPNMVTQNMREGSFINVTDISDLYGVGKAEFRETYKSTRVLTDASFAAIDDYVRRVQKLLTSRKGGYSGIALKRALANDRAGMLKKLEKNSAERANAAVKEAKTAGKSAAKQASKQAEKAALRNASARILGGVLFGAVLYVGLWAIDSGYKGQDMTSNASTQGSKKAIARAALKQLRTNVQNQKNADIITAENLALIAQASQDDGTRYIIAGDDELRELLNVYSCIVTSPIGDALIGEIIQELESIEAPAQLKSNVSAQLKQALRS